jgi:Transposase DDE domain group 1
MLTECSQDSFDFGTVERRQVVGAFDGGTITSDAGALLGQTDNAIRLVSRLAACFQDARCPALVVHQLPAMLRQRIFGIALGYEDIVDHDQLRHDPVLGVLGGALTSKRSDCAPLAGKSTLNRLEHSAKVGADPYHKITHDPAAIERLFVELMMDAHDEVPRQLTIDIDATHDPIHGEQEGRHFNGFYDCYCYLPLYIFAGRHLLAAKLRSADKDAADGTKQEVARIVGQIRERWPDVRIILRADSGFARDDLMASITFLVSPAIPGLPARLRANWYWRGVRAAARAMPNAALLSWKTGTPARVGPARARLSPRPNGSATKPTRALS